MVMIADMRSNENIGRIAFVLRSKGGKVKRKRLYE